MPIKLTASPINEVFGAPTPLQVVQKMVTFYKNDFRKLGDDVIKREYPGREFKTQSSCIWISVIELMKLIADNGANGIRIYFGQHITGNTPSGAKDHESLLAPIFVATWDAVAPDNPTTENSGDLLKESDNPALSNSVVISGYSGMALDQVPICNPKCPSAAAGMMKIKID